MSETSSESEAADISVFSRRKRGAVGERGELPEPAQELGVRAHLLAEGQGQLLAGGVEPVEGVEGVEERADAADAHLFAGGLDDRLGCALLGLAGRDPLGCRKQQGKVGFERLFEALLLIVVAGDPVAQFGAGLAAAMDLLAAQRDRPIEDGQQAAVFL